MKRVWFVIVLWLTKFSLMLCKLFKKSSLNVGGVLAVKLQKDFIKYFTNIDHEKTIFITGTNCKSTVDNMIVHTLRCSSKSVTTNIDDNNLISGVANALIKDSTMFGKMKSEYIVLEIDETYIKDLYKCIKTKNICITNIQKDYTQINGEPDFIYDKIKEVLNDDIRVFLNNEDPRSKALEDYTSNVIYYSVSENEKSYKRDNFYDITLACPKCNNKIQFNYYNGHNIGNFRCSNCDFKSEINPDYQISKIDLERKEFVCNKDKYYMPYSDTIFMYNYALAICVCKIFGITKKQIDESLKDFAYSEKIINYKDKEIKYIIVKQENPQTLEFAFDLLSDDKSKKIVFIGLSPVEDIKPYYTNTFYTFDCDLSKINDSNIERIICFSQSVSYDIANRLIYAGYDKDKITILPKESNAAILKQIKKLDINNIYLITCINKYNELISDIRKEDKDEQYS